VHLSKPRAPNILIGLLYKLIWQAQVIVDVDDEELGFVGAEEPLDIAQYLKRRDGLPTMESLPFKEWTQVAVGMANSFDGITSANAVLQARYGGQIIPHVRNEEVFYPSAQWSAENRARYGIAACTKVVLFLGTPRAHKGLTETATAIATLHDPDILFVIVGDFPDPRLQQSLQGIPGVNYLFLGNQPFSDVPRIVSLANACVLLQDASTTVGKFQSPAKLTDALAMGVPVITSPIEVMTDVIEKGAVIAATAAELPLVLKQVLDGGPAIEALSRRGRAYFEAHLSIAANQPHVKKLTQVVMQSAAGITRKASADLKTLASALGDARINAILP
jgi:glycosyltransferase involved in cell wall biosynthesis